MIDNSAEKNNGHQKDTLPPINKVGTKSVREEKSKRKRFKLALRIFEHIKEKNKEYFENIDNFYESDETLELRRVNDIPKEIAEIKTINTIEHEFDHLELFRPYLNIMKEMETEAKKNFNFQPQLRKVGQEDYKSWIKSIIWDTKDVNSDFRNEIQTIKAGWIPTGNQRTWNQFLTNGMTNQEMSAPRVILYRSQANSLNSLSSANNDLLAIDPNNWFSLFPTYQPQFYTNQWMNEIILQPEDILTATNTNITSDTYFDIDQVVYDEIEKVERKQITFHRDLNNKKTNFTWTDFLYTSADDYYMPPKRSDQFEDEVYRVLIRHSLPALDLQRTLFPTYMDIVHLRRWHRPLVTDYEHGSKMKTGRHIIKNLVPFLHHSFKVYRDIVDASGSQEAFLMKSMKDLTAMNGHLILMEFSEEYPVFISQIGMNSIMRVYYSKSSDTDHLNKKQQYGEVVEIPSNISPFLGSLLPTQHLLSLENNMVRAPLFTHTPNVTDFLAIRNTRGYFIRIIPYIFTVGQQYPKMEVPGPNSKAAMRCARERLQTYIFRMLIKSKDNPKRLKIANVRRAFKQHSENSIRKRLKTCSEYYRHSSVAGKSNWWVLKSDFRLPTHEDMHERLKPEMVCGYYSMLAAQRRLKDAGYGKKSLFMAEEDAEEEVETKVIDEEILCAPWHTSRAYIMSQRGKCLMAINGFADPTGCGEGFSFVRLNHKSTREEGASKAGTVSEYKRMKTNITGTDADLRKLKMNQCRQILGEMGITSDRVDRMQRWDMINMIRRMGSMSCKAGNLQDAIGKFARSAKYSTIESLDKYREECQAIFELQNRCLSSNVEMSSDEEDADDNSELDELTKNLESMLNSKREPVLMEIDKEEQERIDFIKLIQENKSLLEDVEIAEVAPNSMETFTNKLRIHRTFVEGGTRFVRTETVSDQRIINAYLRITRNPNYRQVYARHDTKTMEELRREKKRVQDQLRRMAKHEEKEENVKKSDKSTKREKYRVKPNMRCTACGEIGHMRTNRICPKYYETHPTHASVSPDDKSIHSISPNEKVIDSLATNIDNTVKVEGTRLVVGKALVEAADELNRISALGKNYKDAFGRKRKRDDEDYSYDYGGKINRLLFRRRADPKICLQAIFEDILVKLKEKPESWPFQQPVCTKKVPDYLKIINTPLDLQTMRDYCKRLKYTHRDLFLADINVIRSNSVLYNGLTAPITQSADATFLEAQRLIEQRSDEISALEIEIDPMLSSDPQTRLSYMLEHIVMGAKSLSAAHPFIAPVNPKLVRDYYSFVQKPMDLETIRGNCCNDIYTTCDTFLTDVDLIVNNCILYNGPAHLYSKMAQELRDHIYTMIKKNGDRIVEIEQRLKTTPQDAVCVVSSQMNSVIPSTPNTLSVSSQFIQNTNDNTTGDVETRESPPPIHKDDQLLDDLDLSQESSQDESELD